MNIIHPLTQGQVAKRYEFVTKEKAGGATYTPKNLSDFVAEHIVANIEASNLKQPIRILDPAVGDGVTAYICRKYFSNGWRWFSH